MTGEMPWSSLVSLEVGAMLVFKVRQWEGQDTHLDLVEKGFQLGSTTRTLPLKGASIYSPLAVSGASINHLLGVLVKEHRDNMSIRNRNTSGEGPTAGPLVGPTWGH